ncbi:fatty acid desaturase-domain-containing protein [Gigaspora rosea]|uniref:Fatty acid desaturase-domain-containing protein n=1 Tax=Gigaspora rosea TaxID=44941 RepID=A0A397TYX4_9GLOM|nr:fatty acid desaturase-domain-containing protein [Gigaspora rosea]
MSFKNRKLNDIYDYRHPLYIGKWRKSVVYLTKDFANDNLDEPHLKRKKTILSQYPEIENLYGHDIITADIAIISTMIQVIATYVFSHLLVDWNWTMLFFSFVIGGSITQIYSAVIHETAHCLAASTEMQNRILGLIANIAIPIPIAMSFRRYHLEHHAFQGVDGTDPDLPLRWEREVIGGSTVLKLLWVIFYPIIHFIRIIAMLKSPQPWEYINFFFTSLTNVLIYRYCGYRGLLYLFMSVWFGFSIHPVAARFIQEHYTFDDGQETYSYYGSLNKIFMNIGYHNEHHDFSQIPWTRLPEVRNIASEYYDNLAYHTSWVMVHWNFITQKQFGPQCRVIRSLKAHKKGRKLLAPLKRILS